LWAFLQAPITATPWGEWREFWLLRVFDDRYLVCYFFPLLPILMVLRGRALRVGVVLTGLAFVGYVFGGFYAGFWLLQCLVFHRLAERFAHESQRTDVIRWGPPLAAICILMGWYIGTILLAALALPAELNRWLVEHVPWVFPLGVRGLAWEPDFATLIPGHPRGEPVQLFAAIFWNGHNIGTAYLLWRLVHYFSEIRRGGIPAERRTLLNFLAWVCYAPNWMQGPLERFPAFQDEFDTCHQRRTWRNVPPAAGRIGWGLAKNFLGWWYLRPIVWDRLQIGLTNLYYEHPEQITSYALLYFGIYAQIFWLYLEFSGYCDISAGIARLLGYRQVENFHHPWVATSFRDFWRRWHISLSFILRDYLYIALGGNRRHVLLNLLVTFTLCGIWHGLYFRVAAWGLIMGAMLAVNQAWAQWMKRLDEAAAGWRAGTPTPPRMAGWLPALRRAVVRARPLPTVISWAFTMHCFVMSLLIFFGGSGGVRVMWELIRRPLNAWLGMALPAATRP